MAKTKTKRLIMAKEEQNEEVRGATRLIGDIGRAIKNAADDGLDVGLIMNAIASWVAHIIAGRIAHFPDESSAQDMVDDFNERLAKILEIMLTTSR